MKLKEKLLYLIQDTLTMSKRRIIMSTRNPDIILTSLVTPILVMVLFVYVMGGAMNVGEGVSYINYLVPGIILMCLGQCSAATAVSVSTDISKGIISRFRTMPITKLSVVAGYIMEDTLRKIFTVILVFLSAFIFGFRPEAALNNWLNIAGILFLCCLMLACISVLFGLMSKSPEGATIFAVFANIFPYFSSGFAPTESMPNILRIIAENQPMTPIIESIRALLMGTEVGNNMILAVLWCTILLVISFIATIRVYENKIA